MHLKTVCLRGDIGIVLLIIEKMTNQSALNEKRSQEEYVIKRHVPQINWVKTNTDGSVRQQGKQAACAGVFRDMHGRWVLGFVYEKSASVIMSKLWGVATALQMAWHSGIPKLTVESDSKIAFESLENPFFCI